MKIIDVVEKVDQQSRTGPHAVPCLTEVHCSWVLVDHRRDLAHNTVARKRMENWRVGFHSRDSLRAQSEMGQINFVDFVTFTSLVMFPLDASHVEAVNLFQNRFAIDCGIQRIEFLNFNPGVNQLSSQVRVQLQRVVLRGNKEQLDVVK